MAVIYDNAPKVDKWLREHDAEPFLEWARERQAHYLKDLKGTNMLEDIYRAQGALEILDYIVGLKNELADFLKRKSEGTLQ